MSALPVAWLFYACGLGVEAAGFAILITYSLAMLARIILARVIIGYAIIPWFKQVFLPSTVVVGVAFGVGLLVKLFIREGTLSQIMAVSIITNLCIFILSWVILFNGEERSFISKQFVNILQRMLKRSGECL